MSTSSTGTLDPPFKASSSSSITGSDPMIRSSDRNLMNPPPPTASEECQKQDPSSAVQDPARRDRDLSRRARISIRPATPPPPWLRQFFQKLPDHPVSSPQAPPPQQRSSQPSVSNCSDPQPSSDHPCQTGDATAWLGEEASIAYKEGQPEKEEEVGKLLSSQSQSSSSVQAAVRPPHSTSIQSSSIFEEFDETEEFEEFDEFSAEWISRERWREAEIRRSFLQRNEAVDQAEDHNYCNPRSVQVRFRPRIRYNVVTLFPCDPQMEEEYLSSDSE